MAVIEVRRGRTASRAGVEDARRAGGQAGKRVGASKWQVVEQCSAVSG